MRKPVGVVRNPPYNQHKNAAERSISVTIGQSLAANLNKSDHWHEAAQIPEPSRDQIALLQMAQAEKRHQKNKNKSSQRFPNAEMIFGMRIKHREMQRPETFEDIQKIGPESIGGPKRHRKNLIRRDGVALSDHGNGGAGSGEKQERKFFQRQRPQLF